MLFSRPKIKKPTFYEELYYINSEQELVCRFSPYSVIKKEFKKIGTFYLGNKAEEKLDLGWRLVTNEKLPKEYDL